MNISKKLIFMVVFVVAVSLPLFVFAAESPARYFVKSKSQFWRNSFGVRYAFSGGFTTDLTDWQVRIGKIFGVEIEPVKLLFVLPNETSDKAKEDPEDPIVIRGKGSVRYLPADQTPWGIEFIYQDKFIKKTAGGADVNVAILDTGILITHPDLKSRVKECKDFTGVRTPITDGKCEDKNGHGTHVAGIVGADGGADGFGIYGIAPDVNLWIFRVCSASGLCYADDVSAAIKIAADNGANVINLSLGSDNPSPLIQEGVDYAVSKDVLVVAAAGNDGPYFGSLDYPAAHGSVIGVGAFDVFQKIANWSSRGVNSTTEAYVKNDKDIEFAMPGVNIESTWKDGGYAILSGTSMAAPFISGLAAKYWQFTADNPAESTRTLLHDNSKDIGDLGDDDASGWGFSRVFIVQ